VWPSIGRKTRLWSRRLLNTPLFPCTLVNVKQMAILLGEFATFLAFVAVGRSPLCLGLCGLFVGVLDCGGCISLGHLPLGRTCREPSLANVQNSASWLLWTRSAVFRLASGGVCSGLCGNMLLVGSGMIQGPVLLSLQVPPRVPSATAFFLVTFEALSGALQYWLAGATNVQYAMYINVLAALASVVEVRAVSWAVRRFQRHSLVGGSGGCVFGRAACFRRLGHLAKCGRWHF